MALSLSGCFFRRRLAFGLLVGNAETVETCAGNFLEPFDLRGDTRLTGLGQIIFQFREQRFVSGRKRFDTGNAEAFASVDGCRVNLVGEQNNRERTPVLRQQTLIGVNGLAEAILDAGNGGRLRAYGDITVGGQFSRGDILVPLLLFPL